MKTSIRILSLAVLALAMAACSNDMEQPAAIQTAPGNAGEGIPFSATISTGSATTRALKEDTDEGTIISTWAKSDQVALIHNGVVDVMTAGDPDKTTGNVTITGTLTGRPENNDDVIVVYPASAVDATTKAVKTNLLNAQDGKLANIATSLNLRQSDGAKLKVEGELTATLNGTVKLDNKIAIVKFSLSDGNNALKTTELTISDGSKTITVKPSEAASDLYVAMAPAKGATYDFCATVGSDTYTYSKTGVNLAAGTYYQSPIKMTLVQNAAEITFEKDADSKTWSPTATDNTYQQTLKMNTGDAIPTYSVNTDNTCGASIDASTGVVTFTKAGSVTVTATVADTEHYTYTIKSVSYTLTVNKADGTISFATATPKEALHATAADNTFTQEVTNTGDGTVTYTISDNTCGATIDASTGKVTFTQAGSVTITATVADGTNYTYATKTATYTLSVSDTTDGSGGVPDNDDYTGGGNPF